MWQAPQVGIAACAGKANCAGEFGIHSDCFLQHCMLLFLNAGAGGHLERE
jgi:hypothetical protein